MIEVEIVQFGLEEDVIVGAAYINPQSSYLIPVRAVQTHFTDLSGVSQCRTVW